MDEKEYYARHLRNMRRNSRRIRTLLEKSYTELGREVASHKFINPARFTWAKNKMLGDRVELILGRQSVRLESEITRGVISEWMLASQKNDQLAKSYIRNIYVSNKIRKEIFQTNTEALNAFIKRTDTNQFNLSKRVWRLTKETKAQLKFHISQGIATGKDAGEISRDIRNILVEPNRLYRRVRAETGELVLSRPAKAYKPGAGVYRSSYKNALRLTATETNMAYRASDYIRRKQLPFVAGYKVNLSGQHKVYDICDEMKGIYPKDYRFVGFHPHCLCYTTSILMKKDKFIKYLKTGKIDKKFYVDKIPIKAERFVNKNASKIAKMKSKPYWTENFDEKLKLKPSVGKARAVIEPSADQRKIYERVVLEKQVALSKLRDHEEGYFISNEGKILSHQVGKKGRIDFTKDEIDLLYNPGENITFIHNHPTGTSFSFTDIRLLFHSPGMKEIQAASSNPNIRQFYTIRLNEIGQNLKANFSKWDKAFASSYDEIMHELVKEYGRSYICYTKVWEKLAKAWGLEYKAGYLIKGKAKLSVLKY